MQDEPMTTLDAGELFTYTDPGQDPETENLPSSAKGWPLHLEIHRVYKGKLTYEDCWGGYKMKGSQNACQVPTDYIG